MMKRIISILILIIFVLLLSDPLWGNDDHKAERGRFSHIKSVTSLKTVYELEKSGDQAAVPLLTGALKKNSGVHRLAAIHALATIGGAEAERFLKDLWKELGRASEQNDFMFHEDSIAGEKAFVAAALHKLGQKDYVDFVYGAIKHDNKLVRYNTAAAMGMVNTPKSKQMLMDVLLNDEMDIPRCGAADTLVELQDIEGIKLIKQMIESAKGPTYCLKGLVDTER